MCGWVFDKSWAVVVVWFLLAPRAFAPRVTRQHYKGYYGTTRQNDQILVLVFDYQVNGSN